MSGEKIEKAENSDGKKIQKTTAAKSKESANTVGKDKASSKTVSNKPLDSTPDNNSAGKKDLSVTSNSTNHKEKKSCHGKNRSGGGSVFLGFVLVWVLLAGIWFYFEDRINQNEGAIKVLTLIDTSETQTALYQKQFDSLAQKMNKIDAQKVQIEENSNAIIQMQDMLGESPSYKTVTDSLEEKRKESLEKMAEVEAAYLSGIAIKNTHDQSKYNAVDSKKLQKLEKTVADLIAVQNKQAQDLKLKNTQIAELKASLEDVSRAEHKNAKAITEVGEQSLQDKLKAELDLTLSGIVLSISNVRQRVHKALPKDLDLTMLKDLVDGDKLMADTVAAMERSLAALEEGGNITIEYLRQQFKTVSRDIIRASKAVGEEGGLWDQAVSKVQQSVTIRKIGDVTGDGVEAIVSRAELWLKQGNVKQTIAELEKLQGKAAEAAHEWLEKLKQWDALEKQFDKLYQRVVELSDIHFNNDSEGASLNKKSHDIQAGE